LGLGDLHEQAKKIDVDHLELAGRFPTRQSFASPDRCRDCRLDIADQRGGAVRHAEQHY
jgi:hypothetical protein